MAKTTSFVLGDDLSEFIQERIEQGEFASVSEVVRTALEAFAEQTRREAELCAALDRGLASKRAKPGVFARVRRRHGIPKTK
jgi:antitoxin ParD1/3/4